jgi:hypothetical protein
MAVVFVLAAGWCASAQPTLPVAVEETWEAAVTGSPVYVRSKPDIRAYPCLKLTRGATVTVAGRDGDWLKILPPPGAFSIISKGLVKANAAKTAGVVTGDRVRVRAGTTEHDWKRVIDHWAVQQWLDTGDAVKILGEGEEFYKIAPPKGAYFWIAARYVARGAAGMPTTRPAGSPTTRPTTRPAGTVTVVQEASLPEVKTALKAYEAAEKALFAEYDKPAGERDLRKVLDEYRAISVDAKSYLRPYIDARIRFLEMSLDRTKELEAVRELTREAAAAQLKFDIERTKVEVATTTRPATYAARGVLIPSALFPGGPQSPKRYVVRGPATLRITAYAQCTAGMVNLDDYVGKEVGLLGSRTYDAGLDADIVDVQQVVVLKEKAELPEPPEPVVQPYVQPKKAPTTRPAATPRPARPVFEASGGKPAPRKGPLPKTGFSVVTPKGRSTTRPVDEKEYD